jgi:hypothetical protein
VGSKRTGTSDASGEAWELRYFVLSKDALSIFADASCGELVQTIALSHITGVVPSVSHSVSHVFLIRSAEPGAVARTLAVKAKSGKLQAGWIVAIITAQHKLQEAWLFSQCADGMLPPEASPVGGAVAAASTVGGGGGGASGGGGDGSSVPATAYADPDTDSDSGDDAAVQLGAASAPADRPLLDYGKRLKEGSLVKAGFLHKLWKPRYFVLTLGGLSYYTDMSCKTKKGSIELKNIVGVVPDPG